MTWPSADKPRIEKLSPLHDLSAFDCGVAALNRYLSGFALANQRSGSSQTYIAIIGVEVAGFYTLTFGEITQAEAPERLAKGLPRFPVPVMILARLGVSTAWQGRGLGSGLLKDAFRRVTAASEIIGGRAMVVHAKDERVRDWYKTLDFVPLTEGSLTLYRLLKDLKALLAP